MQNLYFISNDETGDLVIVRIPRNAERSIEKYAERHGIHQGDLTWGGVSSISINI